MYLHYNYVILLLLQFWGDFFTVLWVTVLILIFVAILVSHSIIVTYQPCSFSLLFTLIFILITAFICYFLFAILVNFLLFINHV